MIPKNDVVRAWICRGNTLSSIGRIDTLCVACGFKELNIVHIPAVRVFINDNTFPVEFDSGLGVIPYRVSDSSIIILPGLALHTLETEPYMSIPLEILDKGPSDTLEKWLHHTWRPEYV